MKPRQRREPPQKPTELDSHETGRASLTSAVVERESWGRSAHDVFTGVIDDARVRDPRIERFDTGKLDRATAASEPVHLAHRDHEVWKEPLRASDQRQIEGKLVARLEDKPRTLVRAPPIGSEHE